LVFSPHQSAGSPREKAKHHQKENPTNDALPLAFEDPAAPTPLTSPFSVDSSRDLDFDLELRADLTGLLSAPHAKAASHLTGLLSAPHAKAASPIDRDAGGAKNNTVERALYEKTREEAAEIERQLAERAASEAAERAEAEAAEATEERRRSLRQRRI
jgi:hypothetical protein